MEENIIGGVSPLKRKSMRRGKSYGSGKRGTGDTRYKRDKRQNHQVVEQQLYLLKNLQHQLSHTQ